MTKFCCQGTLQISAPQWIIFTHEFYYLSIPPPPFQRINNKTKAYNSIFMFHLNKIWIGATEPQSTASNQTRGTKFSYLPNQPSIMWLQKWCVMFSKCLNLWSSAATIWEICAGICAFDRACWRCVSSCNRLDDPKAFGLNLNLQSDLEYDFVLLRPTLWWEGAEKGEFDGCRGLGDESVEEKVEGRTKGFSSPCWHLWSNGAVR